MIHISILFLVVLATFYIALAGAILLLTPFYISVTVKHFCSVKLQVPSYHARLMLAKSVMLKGLLALVNMETLRTACS